jgi:hypothetical protein
MTHVGTTVWVVACWLLRMLLHHVASHDLAWDEELNEATDKYA